MNVRFTVCLSKAWRNAIPRDPTRSGAVLARDVAMYVEQIIRANESKLPKLRSLTSTYESALYTPMFDAPAWQWWNKVIIECDLDTDDESRLADFVKNLEPLLPTETHVEP